ncbi:MAG: GNAT family N-acetyltransferase [Candidatus Nanopelagicaceae bacterium]|nr:GNAT family N-acetyltransferase [Candidatus Nanopelagicaceae bacterium]
MANEIDQSQVLDDAVWSSLVGPHAILAEAHGMARRYPADISPFGAIEDHHNPQAWRDLSQLIGIGGHIVLTGKEIYVPDGWQIIDGGLGLQMTGDDVEGELDAEVIPLGDDDVPEMLDLVSRAQPGPFLLRTIEFGGYLGIRVNDALVAMAGCRIHPRGWREISSVCTDESQRGKGMAGRLVKAVAANIRAEGDTPFLHVSETNENAIRLYKALGFQTRMQTRFAVVREISA